MDAAIEQLQALLELESRHDELLDRLAELDQRVTEALARCQTPRPLGPDAGLGGEDRAERLAAAREAVVHGAAQGAGENGEPGRAERDGSSREKKCLRVP